MKSLTNRQLVVVAGGVTVYALGDMIIYNRKKRAQFYEEQKAIHQNAIHNAKQLIAAGTASEQDIEFIRREEEHDRHLAEVARKKAEHRGIFQRGKELLFWGLKKDEEDEIRESSTRQSQGVLDEVNRLGDKAGDISKAINTKQTEVAGTVKEAFAEEKRRQSAGGPLDQLGSKLDDAEQPKSGGWTSWMIRK